MCSKIPAPGDAVEVLSDDGDTAWRPARVIHRFASCCLFFVAFDGGSGSVVKETVSAERIRPRPDSSADAIFEIHQLVEALAGGVWRPGVVSEAHVSGGERRYMVCFASTREVMEFGGGEVRARRDWVDGEWVPVEAKGTTETSYSIGSQVEVSHISSRLPVAWYTALIIKVIDENVFLVEYKNLRAEDDTLLKEIIASQYIRPHPPPTLKVRSFGLLDEVEAFFNNAWWPGVIARVNPGSRYNVKFMYWEEEIEFSHSKLRLLHDWIDGKWVQASQEKSMNLQNLGGPKSAGHVQLLHASNCSFKCNLPDSITSLSVYGDGSLSDFRRSATSSENGDSDRATIQSELEGFQPCKRARKGDAIEGNTRLLDLRGAETSITAKTGFEVGTPIIDADPVFRIKALGQKCHSANPFSEDPLMHEKHKSLFINKTLDKGVYLSKERSGTNEGQYKHVWQSMTNYQKAKELISGIQPQRDKGVRKPAGRERRKNNKPRKLTIIKPSLEGESTAHQRDNEVLGEVLVQGLSIGQTETTECGICSDNGLYPQELSNMMVGHSDVTLAETSASVIQISEAGSEAQNEALVPEIGKQLAKRSLAEKAGDGPRPQQSPLPFDKSSLLWDPLEATEAFSVMPQQPHFRLLEQFRKEFREGMAIGLMVTFSNLVTSVGNLRIVDSRHKFDAILKSLAHLEAHGFDVQRVRARTLELLSMKDNREQLEDERAAAEAGLVKKKMERARVSDAIGSIDEAVRELENSLVRLYQEKSRICEQKIENDSELRKLEVDSRALQGAIVSARDDFEAILSAAW